MYICSIHKKDKDMKDLTPLSPKSQRINQLATIIKAIQLILNEPNNQEYLKEVDAPNAKEQYYALLIDELECIADEADLPEGLTMEEAQLIHRFISNYIHQGAK